MIIKIIYEICIRIAFKLRDKSMRVMMTLDFRFVRISRSPVSQSFFFFVIRYFSTN